MPSPLNKNKPIWVTHDGCKIPIRDLSDQHLANAINFLGSSYDRNRRVKLVAEAKRRGLFKEFYRIGQMPHIGADGKWHMWNFDKSKDVVISRNEANAHGPKIKTNR